MSSSHAALRALEAMAARRLMETTPLQRSTCPASSPEVFDYEDYPAVARCPAR